MKTKLKVTCKTCNKPATVVIIERSRFRGTYTVTAICHGVEDDYEILAKEKRRLDDGEPIGNLFRVNSPRAEMPIFGNSEF